jgi:hypothetical protein
VIVDEFSKMSDRPGAAIDLVERVRSAGVAVVLAGQTWASIGPDESTRQRLAGTVGTVIVHQLKQPDQVAALAGTEWTLERTEQTRTTDHTGLGSQRVGNRYVMHPDEVRGLQRGEAFAIHGGQAIRLAARPVRSSPPDTFAVRPQPESLDAGNSVSHSRNSGLTKDRPTSQ